MFTVTDLIVRLTLSFIIGGLIGFERELHGRVAGLRTHMLVCLGSTLLMLTSIYMLTAYGADCNIDPTRLAAGVMTGIGFLGAGTIMRFRASVRGLTTAASLWAVTGIGLAIGSGFTSGAYIAAALMLVVLLVLTKVEKSIVRKDQYRVLSLETKGHAEQLKEVRRVLAEHNCEIKDLEIKKKPQSHNMIVEFELKLVSPQQSDQIIDGAMRIEGVEGASWKEV
ncbi:MAG: MgtC/SapB family protein [Candidatus Omnitrophica bacterium]|nr:MgtC/SapB family protein [Candidatus Omnitrophota bacterium]